MLITDLADMENKILLGHGSGGQLTHELISKIFVRHFDNHELKSQTDSAVINIDSTLLSFTTDSFVVDPIFFPGGDIGKLAIAGTVNDLAVSGATPLYLSASFIIEEGFDIRELEEIVVSMATEAKKAKVKIVTGDTKVVDKGKCDKLFINTTGVGKLSVQNKDIGLGANIESGDKIIINGSIGDHGMSVLAAREYLSLYADLKSDCASLNHLIKKAMDASSNIKFMRDATRGGLATVLAELSSNKDYGVQLDESAIVINEKVRGMCEILGFDPLYVANEGKVVLVVSKNDAEKVLAAMRSDKLGKESLIIGEIVNEHPGKAWIKTVIGGNRILDMLAGEQLPRIC